MFPSLPFYIVGYSFPAWFWSLIVLIQILFGPLVVMHEKKWDYKILIGFLAYPFYCLTWLPVTIAGIKDSGKKEWAHTVHTRNITIEDIEKS
ncbi:hypothetical protein [Thermoclostridium stercorarium]